MNCRGGTMTFFMRRGTTPRPAGTEGDGGVGRRSEEFGGVLGGNGVSVKEAHSGDEQLSKHIIAIEWLVGHRHGKINGIEERGRDDLLRHKYFTFASSQNPFPQSHFDSIVGGRHITTTCSIRMLPIIESFAAYGGVVTIVFHERVKGLEEGWEGINFGTVETRVKDEGSSGMRGYRRYHVVGAGDMDDGNRRIISCYA